MNTENSNQPAEITESEAGAQALDKDVAFDQENNSADEERALKEKLMARELKSHRIREQLTDLYLENDGLGRALGTALNELGNLNRFDLDDSGKLVVKDEFGRRLLDEDGLEVDAGEVVRAFLGEREYLVASNWRGEPGEGEIDLADEMDQKGKSKGGRMELAQRIFGKETAPSEYDERQESAGSYLARRRKELLDTSATGKAADGKTAGVSSRNSRLRLGRELTKK